MIIEQTLDILKSRHKSRIENLTLIKVHMGMHLSAVQLSDGSCGVAGNAPNNGQHAPRKKERDFGDFTPNQIGGRKVLELLETTKQGPIIDTLKIAVLNALSSGLLADSGYTVMEDKDPMELLDLSQTRKITIVGAFQSYIRTLAAAGHHLRVLEMNEESLGEELKKFYVPAQEYPSVIPDSDVVIITGLTLVNHTIDGLLSHIKPGAQVVVTGPSANILPEVLFSNGVTIIGATRITDPEMLFSTVSEGGSGYHLFRYGARKICVVKG